MVEKFCRQGKAILSVGAQRSDHPVHFSSPTELQKWLKIRQVDFVEIFRGHGELTVRVREAGCSASEGFDSRALTYDRHWCLGTVRDQTDCAWLLVHQLRPKVVHMSTPCSASLLNKHWHACVAQHCATHCISDKFTHSTSHSTV